MSSDYGLLRALLKRLPLSKAFKAVSLKRKLRPISKKRNVQGTENPSLSASILSAY
jgi:hypothetical protein